jgi:hypothetical protein
MVPSQDPLLSTLVLGGPHLTPAVMIIPPAMVTMFVFKKEAVALAFWW